LVNDKRILVVDADHEITRKFNEAFMMNGFAGDVLNDSLLALSTIRNNVEKYDTMIIDMRLPGKSGIELARDIKEVKPSASLILMSSNVQDYYRAEKTLKNNSFSFVKKPETINEIVTLISNADEGLNFRQ
jgi:DNA-binding NtrC family response regulator